MRHIVVSEITQDRRGRTPRMLSHSRAEAKEWAGNSRFARGRAPHATHVHLLGNFRAPRTFGEFQKGSAGSTARFSNYRNSPGEDERQHHSL